MHDFYPYILFLKSLIIILLIAIIIHSTHGNR